MAKLFGFQKKFAFLVVSFLFSCIHRTMARDAGFQINQHSVSVPARKASQGLALWFDRSSSSPDKAGSARQYFLELNKSFPWVRLNTLTREAVPVSVASIAHLSELAVPELRGFMTSSTLPTFPSCSPGGPVPPSPPPCPGCPSPGPA